MISIPASDLSGRVNHQVLKDQLAAAGFAELPWMGRWNADGSLVSIDFDVPLESGFDPEAIESVFKAHLRDPEEKDDKQLLEERKAVEAQTVVGLQSQVDELKAQVAVLLARLGPA